MVEPPRRRSSDDPEVRLTLLEKGLADHLTSCDSRQKEIKEMFLELRGSIDRVGTRMTAMQFGWMTTGMGLLGSGAVFLFGKVMKWW
jgi:hypothetical protein